MNRGFAFLEAMGTRILVLVVGVISMASAQADERPVYLTTLPIEALGNSVQSGAFFKARDLSAFKSFLENKYGVRDLRLEDLGLIIREYDLQEYQTLNRESADVPGRTNPTCIC